MDPEPVSPDPLIVTLLVTSISVSIVTFDAVVVIFWIDDADADDEPGSIQDKFPDASVDNTLLASGAVDGSVSV